MNKIILGVLMIAVLLFVGCGENTSDKTVTHTFIGGTNAIEIKFLEGSPPPEVFDGGGFPFDVTVSLENKGEYDVNKADAKVWLSGFYPEDFSLTTADITKNPTEDLMKSYIDSEGNIIPGTITYMTIPGFNFKGSLKGNNDYKVWANVCYKYGTVAQADMCVLDDLTKATSKNEKRVCEVVEKKSVKSSSSPVQIENFQETVSGTNSITYTFEIVQRGAGQLSKPNSGCDDTIGIKDKAYVKIDSGGLAGLICSGFDGGEQKTTEGFTTLFGGKRIIRCTQDTTGLSGDFEKKVSITLEFDYKEHIESSITVKHSTG